MSAKAVIQRRTIVSSIFLGVLCSLATLPSRAAAAQLGPEDIAWLQRVGFGIDSAELADYQKRGRADFLDEQLAPRGNGNLPLDIAA